jgi:hypothetical protein
MQKMIFLRKLHVQLVSAQQSLCDALGGTISVCPLHASLMMLRSADSEAQMIALKHPQADLQMHPPYLKVLCL